MVTQGTRFGKLNLDQWCSIRDYFVHPPWGHLAMPGDIFGCHHLGSGDVIIASSGQRPETLLNILQSTGQAPATKNICPQMSIALRWRNPGLDQSNLIW